MKLTYKILGLITIFLVVTDFITTEQGTFGLVVFLFSNEADSKE